MQNFNFLLILFALAMSLSYILIYSSLDYNSLVKIPHPVEPSFAHADVNNLCDASMKFSPHTKVLSYSIFGTIKKYYDGIPIVIRDKRNSTFYKDWQLRIYHDGNVPNTTLRRFENERDIIFCDGRRLPRYGDLSVIFQMYWRFIPIADPSVDVFCSRDLDSAILTREEDAVKEYMASGKILHTMRDHPYHDIPILGGMWCFSNRLDRQLGRNYMEQIMEKAKTNKIRNDQPILNAVIWNNLKDKLNTMVFQHDSYNCIRFKFSRPFPTKRKSKDFYVGCDQHDCKTTKYKLSPCPVACRPSHGKSWEYC